MIDSLGQGSCPTELEPCLQALWYDAKGKWEMAHEIVQQRDHDMMAMRIHAYLHRKEGEEWNSRYWHRQAGTEFPQGVRLEEEWESLVWELTE